MKVAILGLGSIGSRHARNLERLGHAPIGFDPRPVKPTSFPIAATVDDALSAADAVVVATPTSLHADHALLALHRGLPVLVEKPLATNPAEAEQVAALARAENLTCGVAMNLRFHPAINELRALLSDGTLGRVLYAQVSCGSDLRAWRPGTDYRTTYSARAELGGGVVRDCVHELDYLTWLLGPAVSVTAEVEHASALEIDVEDLGLALIRLAGGALASLDLTYFDPAYRRGCLLVGADASARWDWTAGTIEVRRNERVPEIRPVDADVGHTYVAEVKDFLDAVSSSRPPRTTAEEGVAVVRLAEAILQSAHTGRRLSL